MMQPSDVEQQDRFDEILGRIEDVGTKIIEALCIAGMVLVLTGLISPLLGFDSVFMSELTIKGLIVCASGIGLMVAGFVFFILAFLALAFMSM